MHSEILSDEIICDLTQNHPRTWLEGCCGASIYVAGLEFN